MRHARPLLTGIAIGCACASGCRPVAALGRTGALRSDMARWANDAAVGAVVGDGEGTSIPVVATTTGRDLEADVSLEFRGDHIEYSLRLRNPHSALVTAAWVTATGAADRPESPVIVLFTGSRYRERFLEVRGTGRVPASMRAASLAEDLRARPASFVVTLRGADFEEIWSGRLGERR